MWFRGGRPDGLTWPRVCLLRAKLLMAAATATRLLVLGVVRGAGQAHGYDVRRELLSIGADEWANVAPGSVYNALKSLVRDGMLDVVGTDRQGARPERTVYGLTAAGEDEFQRLLWDNVRHAEMANHPLLAGLAFLPLFPREELVAVMRHRYEELRERIGARQRELRAVVGGSGDPARGGVPFHVAESYRLIIGLLEAEAAWARDFADRLERGEAAGLSDGDDTQAGG